MENMIFDVEYMVTEKATGNLVKEGRGYITVRHQAREMMANWVARKKVKRQVIRFLEEQWIKHTAEEYEVDADVIGRMLQDGVIPKLNLWDVQVKAVLVEA